MLKKLLSQTLVAALMLGATASWGAYDSGQDEDVIGSLLQDIKQQRETQSSGQQVAALQAPKAEIASDTSASADPLYASYENMARSMTRAALATKREIFTQPRAHIEEFLRATLTQASYETGRFKSQLATGAFNYWGMKDRMDVGQDKIFYKGENYEKFSSAYEGCLGYMRAICRDRYAGWDKVMSDKRAFLRHISSSGWCPDGDYVSMSMQVYEADKEKIDRAVKVAADEILKTR